MNVYELINYEGEFHLKNPYIHIEKKIIDMFIKRDDAINNESIEIVNNM